MTQRKRIVILVAVVLFVALIAFIVVSIVKQKNKYTITEERTTTTASNQGSEIKVDTSAIGNSFIDSHKEKITSLALDRSTFKSDDIDKPIVIVARSNSFTKISTYEQSIIVDIDAIQTSYKISYYHNEVDKTTIINLLCLPDEDKIYSKDYCYEV